MKFRNKLLSTFFFAIALIFSTSMDAAVDENRQSKRNGIGNYDGNKTGNTYHQGNQGNKKRVGNTGPKKPKKGKKGKKGKKKNTTSIPLDGGLSILLLGAAAFGIRKLRNKE